MSGKHPSTEAIAEQENVSKRFIQERLKLALLSPELITQIIDGKNNSNLYLEKLKGYSIPLDWSEQIF